MHEMQSRKVLIRLRIWVSYLVMELQVKEQMMNLSHDQLQLQALHNDNQGKYPSNGEVPTAKRMTHLPP